MNLSPLQLNPALLSNATGKDTPAAPKDAKMEQIEETARDFEAMFLSEMLKPMFETVDVDKNFGGGRGEEVFKSFLVDEYGKQLSATGGLGIADQVKEELIRMQTAANKPALAQNMHGNSGKLAAKEGGSDV